MPTIRCNVCGNEIEYWEKKDAAICDQCGAVNGITFSGVLRGANPFGSNSKFFASKSKNLISHYDKKLEHTRNIVLETRRADSPYKGSSSYGFTVFLIILLSFIIFCICCGSCSTGTRDSANEAAPIVTDTSAVLTETTQPTTVTTTTSEVTEESVVDNSQLVDLLIEMGYSPENAAGIAEVLNSLEIYSIDIYFQSTTDVENGLCSITGFPNGSDNYDEVFYFTTENGVVFYVGFTDYDLYDTDSHDGFIMTYTEALELRNAEA